MQTWHFKEQKALRKRAEIHLLFSISKREGQILAWVGGRETAILSKSKGEFCLHP